MPAPVDSLKLQTLAFVAEVVNDVIPAESALFQSVASAYYDKAAAGSLKSAPAKGEFGAMDAATASVIVAFLPLLKATIDLVTEMVKAKASQKKADMVKELWEELLRRERYQESLLPKTLAQHGEALAALVEKAGENGA